MRPQMRKVLSESQKEARIKELVEQAVEAKAHAPNKALKRRVFQRARKKLAHLLTQEEFEVAVERLKHFEEEVSVSDGMSDAASPIADATAAEGSPMRPQTPLCLRLPIIAVPFFVPVMPTPTMQETNIPYSSPLSSPQNQAAEQPITAHCAFVLPPVAEAETPRVRASMVNLESPKANDVGLDTNSKRPTPRAVYHHPVNAPASTSPREWDEGEGTLSRSLTDGYSCLPIQRTFIQFNTCEHVGHRRSRSI